MVEVPLSKALGAIGGLIFEGEYIVPKAQWLAAHAGNEGAKQSLYALMQSVVTYEHAFHWDSLTHYRVTKREIYDLTWKKGVRP